MKRALLVLALVFAVGCGAPCLDSQPDGTYVRFDDPEEDLSGFVSHPWPSDALVTRRGLELRHFPNPTESSTLDDYLEIISRETDAFGTTSAFYLGFSAPVNELTLPEDRVGSLAADATIFLIEIDADSPERGRRFPMRLRYGNEASLYLEANHLILLPPYGVQLAGGTTYALIVSKNVKDLDGAPIVASQHSHNAMYGGCEESTPDRIFSAFASFRDYLDDDPALDEDDIAAATVFTTQSAVPELRELAAVARAVPAPVPTEWETVAFHPRLDRYDAVIELAGFQEGEIPYESLGDGGELARDADGNYTVTHTERTRLGFSIPRLEMPANGWPVVLYSHGTGGSYESVFNGEVARLLAQKGIASVGYDQTLHGPRAPAGTDPEITFFNLFNPVAARDNIRQGAADAVILTNMLEEMRIPSSVTGGAEVKFDPSRIGFVGHSQGGLVGAGFAAIDERPKAYLFSGLGAILSVTLQVRKDIIDFKALFESLLSLPPDQGLDDFHPVLNLVQTFIDRADPIAYARSYLGDPPAGANRDFLQVEGFLDFASPARGQEAFAAAAQFPNVPPVHRVPPAAEFVGPAPTTAPAVANVPTSAGPVTAGLIQYPDETHFPIFDNQDARLRYLEFLRSSLLEGRGKIIGGE